ncbi:Carbamoyltransferase [Burkholderia dolosa AU0158]|nr:Carbamoyltransferase [Burkholderia dolosa AU0158]
MRDGVVIAAAEDERFTHVKHAKRPVPFSTWELPYHAIDYCLAEAGIALADVHHVAYSYDPWLELDRHGDEPVLTLPLSPSAHAPRADGASPWHPLFLSSIVNAPRQLAGGAPHHLQRRFRGVTHEGPFRWHFVEHHLAHEASAFLADAVRALRGDDDGRARRARDDQLRRVRRPRLPAHRPGEPAAFARAAVRARHAVSRLPAFVGRVQGDGARVVRQAGVCRPDAQARPLSRRRALRGRQRGSGRAVRSRARAWRVDRAASLRHRARAAARARGDGAAGGRLARRRDRREESRDGGRRRAELRDECADPRSRSVRRRVGAAGRRRRGHRARRRAVDRFPDARRARRLADGPRVSRPVV